MSAAAAGHLHERRATWLELFYDLVFVIAIAKVASRLNLHVSLPGLGIFVGMFLIVCWPWTAYSAFSSRFELDDRFHRIVTLLQMLAAAGMAVCLGDLPGVGEVGFAAAYVAMRVCLLVLYARAYRRITPSRKLLGMMMTGYALSGVIWATSMCVPDPARYVLWGAGVIVDMSTPLVCHKGMRRHPADPAHLPERFGGFTLIVLGESIYAVVSGLGVIHWQAAGNLAAVLGFGLAACFWWSYFSYVERAPLQCSLGDGQAYMYLHMPMVQGITLASTGVGHIIREAGDAVIEPGTLWLLLGGVTLWLGGFLAIQLFTYPPNLGKRLWQSYGPLFAVLAVLAIAGQTWPPLAVLAVVVLGFATLAAMDVRWRVAVPARAYKLAGADPRDTAQRKTYRGTDVEVSFDSSLCIHSGECLRRLPVVFNVRERPWVRTDRASAVEIVAAVHHCPTGALKIERGPKIAPVDEAAGAATLVTLVPNGPILIAAQGGISIEGEATPDAPMLALCRCERSTRYPFCDGSHEKSVVAVSASKE